MNTWQKITKYLRSRKRSNYLSDLVALQGAYSRLQDNCNTLAYGNEELKKQNKALLELGDSPIKKDLNEAINIILDYQTSLYRIASPDPNIQRANNLLNKWGIRSGQVNGLYKVFIDGEEITRGREY